MVYPTPPELIAWFDANPGRYKNTPEPDGYNPTDALGTELAYRGDIANPVPQPNVYENLPTVQGTKALLVDQESAGRLGDTWWAKWTELIGQMGHVITESETERRNTAQEYVDNAFQRANVSQTEKDAINAYVSSNVPDPTWPATVPGPSDSQAQFGVGGIAFDYIDQSLGR